MKVRYAEIANIDILGNKVKAAAESPALRGIFYVEDGSVINEKELLDSAARPGGLTGSLRQKTVYWLSITVHAGGNGVASRTVAGIYEPSERHISFQKIDGRLVYLDKMTVEKVV